ncbi:uncharacterized protein LACBIDRAFT_303367 [Laccaria bicolor S238N-H82]|uniref:Predicted protein n=1 Tax=Laccaria bicolor (strain S238N-H82 / ATCC MYA-4686) TaxID=486041 RepID=B0DJE2_LACBS|nr:uncharacterized protein LACBIDRAFT_303367 [Laccaria bicolor S238N-H82]EDR05388.1 predicted protein [Laccaria bicolor S238N-H82]|eukprot:XP_001883946.1 predicted protein [Laccaria bicolor S238N-H82]
MGIPKFFRYVSEIPIDLAVDTREQHSRVWWVAYDLERAYPMTLLSDNLYLDFNGIIHNCSRPNDEDAHFRLTEEQNNTSIFTYVDRLFGKIKLKKLFFMAVDGVAPRAKMNQ